MSDPSLDALARLATAAQAMLGAATPGPWRVEHGRTFDTTTGAVASVEAFVRRPDDDVAIAADIVDPATGLRSDANAALIAAAPDLARGLVAAVDALRAERDRRDALAAAVRDVGSLIAEHGCSCDCDCTHTTGEHTSACDPCLACRASDVVSPLLRGAPADVVRAGVVRAYLDAEERWREGSGVYLPGEDVTAYVARREAERVRVNELHRAMFAALAAAEGR